MLNNSSFTGRFTKIPQLKYTPSGVPVLNFTLAVDRNFSDKQGNVGTDFPRFVAWRKTAQMIAQHYTKGSLIGITANFRTQQWQDQNGQTRYGYYFLVNSTSFMESKQVTEQRRAKLGQQQPAQNQNQPNNQQNPFSPQPNNSNKQLAGVNANNQQNNSANQANGNNGSANNGGNNQPNNNPSNQNSNQNPKNTGTKKPVNKGGNNKPAPKGNGNKKIDIDDGDLPF